MPSARPPSAARLPRATRDVGGAKPVVLSGTATADCTTWSGAAAARASARAVLSRCSTWRRSSWAASNRVCSTAPELVVDLGVERREVDLGALGLVAQDLHLLGLLGRTGGLVPASR